MKTSFNTIGSSLALLFDVGTSLSRIEQAPDTGLPGARHYVPSLQLLAKSTGLPAANAVQGGAANGAGTKEGTGSSSGRGAYKVAAVLPFVNIIVATISCGPGFLCGSRVAFAAPVESGGNIGSEASVAFGVAPGNVLLAEEQPDNSVITTRGLEASTTGFVFGAAGSNSCPSGSAVITSLTACHGAATALGKKVEAVSNWDNLPKGCFEWGAMMFNHHPIGAGDSGYRPVCKAGAPSKSPTMTPTGAPSKTPSEAPSNTPTGDPSSVPTTTPSKSRACQEHSDCGAGEKCKNDQNMDKHCKKRKADCKVRGTKKKRWGCQNGEICKPVGSEKWAKCSMPGV